MTAARIIVSPQAEQDLAQIVDEISSRAGPSIADNLFIESSRSSTSYP